MTTERVVPCPHGCGEDAPTVDYLAAHIANVHGFDRETARAQAEIAFRAAPEEATVSAKNGRNCGKCGKPGHNARSCAKGDVKRADKPSRNGNGGDPIVHAIDAKIGTLRDEIEARAKQINALEAAKAALA